MIKGTKEAVIRSLRCLAVEKFDMEPETAEEVFPLGLSDADTVAKLEAAVDQLEASRIPEVKAQIWAITKAIDTIRALETKCLKAPHSICWRPE